MKQQPYIWMTTIAIFLAAACRKSQEMKNATPDSVQSVGTFAGNGQAGYADGQGATASFNTPYGVVVDTNGNVLVSDLGNGRIRKISPAGLVTTLAGNGLSGYTDGTGKEASFDGPMGMFVGQDNMLYVAEAYNGDIRQVTPAGVVTTAIPSSAWYYSNASITSLALDKAGNLYATDASNNAVYLVGAWRPNEQRFLEIAAGKSKSDSINYPEYVAIDSRGVVYLSNTGNNDICKIDALESPTVFAGSIQHGHADGSGSQAGLYGPNGIAFDASDNLYVADAANNLIRKITPDGVVTTIAGNGIQGYRDGSPTEAEFNNPTGVALDHDGNLYVADNGNNRIRKIVLGH